MVIIPVPTDWYCPVVAKAFVSSFLNNADIFNALALLAVELTTTYETDRDVGRGPRNFLVTIGYQVVHSSAPSLDTKFYGVNF